MTDTLAACRALLKDAVAEIEALRRQQERLQRTWREAAMGLRQHAAQVGECGYVGEQIRLEERAKVFEDWVKELGGMG